MDETKVKITNPERVARILSKICQSNLQVFMRAKDNLALAVKGKAANIVVAKLSETNRTLTLRISSISEQGMVYLANQDKVQVEFIMMATKVVFVSQIVMSDQNSILLAFPKSLISVERRKNTRFNTNDNIQGFIRTSVWHPPAIDLAAPPIYSHYKALEGMVAIADVSFGGICLVTRFPAISQELKRGKIDEHALLILPMQAPIKTIIEVRWVKKVKEHGKDAYGADRSYTFYKFGCEFMGHSDEVTTGLKQFVTQITQSESEAI